MVCKIDATSKGDKIMIVSAALKMDNGAVISLPAPARHGDVIAALSRLGMCGAVALDAEQGFLTSGGTFADRRLAHRIAFKAGQVAIMEGELYSEDLW
jgi:hypothetical protein